MITNASPNLKAILQLCSYVYNFFVFLKMKNAIDDIFELTRMVKIVLCGKEGMGKSALISRYIHNYFDSNISSTIGASFFSKDVYVDNKKVSLSIWDTAGSERYGKMMPMYTRGAKIVILCFDENHLDDLESEISKISHTNELAEILLVATKSDIHKNYQLAEKYALHNNLKFFLTSSFSGEGISGLFDEVVKIAASSSGHNTEPPVNIGATGANVEHTCCFQWNSFVDRIFVLNLCSREQRYYLFFGKKMLRFVQQILFIDRWELCL